MPQTLMVRKKILLVFPDGVGIRNYLYSDAFEGTNSDLVLFHNFGEETIGYLKQRTEIAQDVIIPEYHESLKEKFLRELICLLRLRYNSKITSNPTILLNWKTSHFSFAKRAFYTAVEAAARFFKNYDDILMLERTYSQAIRDTQFYGAVKTILAQIRPTQVFCSHQRGLKMATIFAAAADLGIPTTTVIYSWDNLPKARLALRADTYCVWSEQMKSDILTFYPEIARDKISITGTPQFNFYGKPQFLIDKVDFYQRYSLDVNKKIICFSGDDEKTSPDDPKYLEDIAASIIENGLEDQFQILFRRCPVDFSGRYDTVTAKYPSLIKEAPPLWAFKKNKTWTDAYPLYDDIALLVSTSYYADVVVNIGSTMAFDFAMNNKPCLFVNYDQPLKQDPKWTTSDIYGFEHFKTMKGFEAVGWINAKDDIAPLLVKALQSPELIGPDRKRWMRKVVGHTGKHSDFTAFAINNNN